MAISVALNEFNRKKSYKGSVNGFEPIWIWINWLHNFKAENSSLGSFCEIALFWLKNPFKMKDNH